MGTTTCLKKKQKCQIVKKIYQAQIKNQIQKFHSIHRRPNKQFQTCSCHTKKVPRWIAQSVMLSITDFWSGAWSVRTCLSVRLWYYLSNRSARRWLLRAVILAWTSMCPGLSAEELNWDTIWGKYEEFCRPQMNEVRAWFDLLTSFRQGSRSVYEWYNVVQAQVNLTKYSPETVKILHCDIFWSFLHDEEFVSKTIYDGTIDLEKFPASKVRKLAKSIESSKVNCMPYQTSGWWPTSCTNQSNEAPVHRAFIRKTQDEKTTCQVQTPSHKNPGNENPQVSSHHKNIYDPKNAHKDKRDAQRMELNPYGRLSVSCEEIPCKACHKFGNFTTLCYQKKQAPFKSRRPKAHQLQARAVYVHRNAICGQSEESSCDDSFCLQLKVQCTQASFKMIPTPFHLITNLAYRLKPPHTRNQYLRARLDTCTDVNIMPACVYRLVFKDPELKKLAPSTMEIGTYMTDTVKIVGSWIFYLVHTDTKKLHEVTFFVAENDGSVILWCTTTLVLGLIQPRKKTWLITTKGLAKLQVQWITLRRQNLK